MAAGTEEAAGRTMATLSQRRCMPVSSDQKGRLFRAQELPLSALELVGGMGERCCFHREVEKLICLSMALSGLLWWHGHWKHRLHDFLKVCHCCFG